MADLDVIPIDSDQGISGLNGLYFERLSTIWRRQPRVGGGKIPVLYDTVRKEMENFFGDDTRQIVHTLEVTSRALQIQAVEGGDRDIVTMASLLHDVGIKPAQEKFGSNAGHYQEKLGPPIAGEILAKAGVGEDKITVVKEMIAHHHTPGKITTKEFACLWDADFIVNLQEVVPGMASEKLRLVIDKKHDGRGEANRHGHLPAAQPVRARMSTEWLVCGSGCACGSNDERFVVFVENMENAPTR